MDGKGICCEGSVLAVIITYNPSLPVLRRNIEILYSQVQYILIYDNASENINSLSTLISEFPNITLFKNTTNEGLPINYNRAGKFCLENRYEWLLTMDQDTIVPPDLILNFSKVFNDSQVAIIAPVMIDINYQKESEVLDTLPDEAFTEVKSCISSAALNRVSILKELGGFDEKLFIDQVDFDYCRNVIEHGYKILRCNATCIAHQIGNSKTVKFLWKDMVSFNHPPFRKYYFFRNRVYYARKYHITILNDPVYYRNLLKHFLVLFYEDKRVEKIKQAIRGLKDGFSL